MVIVMNQDKNRLDMFLEGLTKEGNKKIIYEKVYIRPTKFKSIIGFIASLIFFIILLGLFTFSVMYFVLLIGNILILLFFSINTFTEKGIGLPKNIAYVVSEEEDNQGEEIDEDAYYEQDNSFDEDDEERQ